MNNKKCFSDWQPEHIIINCLKNTTKIVVVLEIAGISINNAKKPRKK